MDYVINADLVENGIGSIRPEWLYNKDYNPATCPRIFMKSYTRNCRNSRMAAAAPAAASGLGATVKKIRRLNPVGETAESRMELSVTNSHKIW